MLLYVKTDEDMTPDNDYMMGGNQISVKTLDLGAEWKEIKTQLESVAAMIAIYCYVWSRYAANCKLLVLENDWRNLTPELEVYHVQNHLWPIRANH